MHTRSSGTAGPYRGGNGRGEQGGEGHQGGAPARRVGRGRIRRRRELGRASGRCGRGPGRGGGALPYRDLPEVTEGAGEAHEPWGVRAAGDDDGGLAGCPPERGPRLT